MKAELKPCSFGPEWFPTLRMDLLELMKTAFLLPSMFLNFLLFCFKQQRILSFWVLLMACLWSLPSHRPFFRCNQVVFFIVPAINDRTSMMPLLGQTFLPKLVGDWQRQTGLRRCDLKGARVWEKCRWTTQSEDREIRGFLWLRSLLKGDAWACDQGTLLLCQQEGTAGDGADAGQDSWAGRLVSERLLFSPVFYW